MGSRYDGKQICVLKNNIEGLVFFFPPEYEFEPMRDYLCSMLVSRGWRTSGLQEYEVPSGHAGCVAWLTRESEPNFVPISIVSRWRASLGFGVIGKAGVGSAMKELLRANAHQP